MPSNIEIIRRASDAALDYFQINRAIKYIAKDHHIGEPTVMFLLFASHLEDVDGFFNYSNDIDSSPLYSIQADHIKDAIKDDLIHKQAYGVYRISRRGRIILSQLLDRAGTLRHKRTRLPERRAQSLIALNERRASGLPKEDSLPSLPWL